VVVGSEVAFWVLMALLFVAAIAALLVGAVFTYSAVVRGQGLGYRPAGLAVGGVAVLLGGAAIPVVVTAAQVDMSAPSPPTDLTPGLVVFLAALTGAPVAVAYWAVVTAALPSRLDRRPGLRTRRYRYRAWSYVVAGLTIVALVWGWTKTGVVSALRIGLVGLGVTVGLRQLERRFDAQVASLPAEISGHVLYLRPFRTESRAMFRLPDDKAEFNGQGLRSYVALDEFLVRGADDRLGQVIALGNPAEFVPRGGATRVYLSDDAWTDELARLADSARFIIIEPGRTESMRWELQYIVHRGLQTKLFILTPPGRRALRWTRRLLAIMDRLNGWQPATWSEFAAELRAVRLDLVPDDPGWGAVVTFRRDGSSVVLARGLTMPARYADVLLKGRAD